MTRNPRITGPLPMALGLVVVGTYLTSALGYFPGPQKLLLLLVFAIGPVAIMGSLSVRRRLASTGEDFWRDLGVVFLVIAFAFFNLMLVVQQYVGLRVRELLAQVPAPSIPSEGVAATQPVREIWRIVDLVQQGIDVSFDIFYCLGLILVAAAMVRHPDFGRFLGYFGMVSGGALLALNLGAFPQIPGESGLVDLGPLTGVWWVLVIIQLGRLDIRDKRAGAEEASGES